MSDVLHDLDSALIALGVFALMAGAMEAGYRVGRRRLLEGRVAEHVNGIQNSVLGILALPLGFTLSLSLQRFDSRSEGVVSEANAIGTAYLRAQLLPAGLRDTARAQLRAYTDLRVDAGALARSRGDAIAALATQAAAAQELLWADARAGTAREPLAHAMVAVLVVLVFVCLDLDRPRRGIIRVSQASIEALQAGMRADASSPSR